MPPDNPLIWINEFSIVPFFGTEVLFFSFNYIIMILSQKNNRYFLNNYLKISISILRL